MALVEINWMPDRRRLRMFGWASVAVFSALGDGVLVRQGLLGFDMSPDGARLTAGALWALAAMSGLLAALAPGAIRPFYIGLSAVGWPVGWLVSHAVLAIVYYGVVTPVGLAMRALGRDPLERKFDSGAETYWVRRRPPSDIKRYFRQF